MLTLCAPIGEQYPYRSIVCIPPGGVPSQGDSKYPFGFGLACVGAIAAGTEMAPASIDDTDSTGQSGSSMRPLPLPSRRTETDRLLNDGRLICVKINRLTAVMRPASLVSSFDVATPAHAFTDARK